jgi:hypothetical protein
VYKAEQTCWKAFMNDEPEPVIVSLACAAGATNTTLASSALAARIPLILRIFLLDLSYFST